MARSILATAAVLAAIGVAGCTVNKQQQAPGLTGPSETGTSLSVSVTPDVIFQDGASQSLVTILAFGPDGQPFRNLSLRAEIVVSGVTTDFGTLSARSLVTDANGRATLTYTAPPPPAFSVDTGTIVDITVTPLSTDFSNSLPRRASIRLVPTGVVQPPTTGLSPRFVFSPAAPTDHQSVIFDASTSTTTNASIVSYQWNFGDGATGAGIATQHAFNNPGTFVVTLTVTDSIGRTNSISQSVTVGAGAVPTAVIIASPASPIIGQAVNFNASTSRPAPGRSIRSYEWDFGDGTSGNGPQTTHAYATAGTYTVVLTVTDDVGRIATSTTPIAVGTGNPTADFTFNPSAPRVGQQVVFDGSPSQAAPGRTITSYSWSFGDGRAGSGQTVTHPGYAAPGTYNVLLTVTDSTGRTASVTKAITVTATP